MNLHFDAGQIRICEKSTIFWQVHQWIKKAILLSFRLNDNYLSATNSSGDTQLNLSGQSFFKIYQLKEEDFRRAGFRAVSGAVVRHSAFIAKNVVLMPSFVNLGAFVDEGTMIDTWATAGSCAQVGKTVCISGGAELAEC